MADRDVEASCGRILASLLQDLALAHRTGHAVGAARLLQLAHSALGISRPTAAIHPQPAELEIMAPEVLVRAEPRGAETPESDMWAVGCLVPLLLGNERLPFTTLLDTTSSTLHEQRLHVLAAIVNSVGLPPRDLVTRFPLEDWPDASSLFATLLRLGASGQFRSLRALYRSLPEPTVELCLSLLRWDPQARLSAAQALAHSALSQPAPEPVPRLGAGPSRAGEREQPLPSRPQAAAAAPAEQLVAGARLSYDAHRQGAAAEGGAWTGLDLTAVSPPRQAGTEATAPFVSPSVHRSNGTVAVPSPPAGWVEQGPSPRTARTRDAPDTATAHSHNRSRRRRRPAGPASTRARQRPRSTDPPAPATTRMSRRRGQSPAQRRDGKVGANPEPHRSSHSGRATRRPHTARHARSIRRHGRQTSPARGTEGRDAGGGDEGETQALLRAAESLKAALGRSVESTGHSRARRPPRPSASRRRDIGDEGEAHALLCAAESLKAALGRTGNSPARRPPRPTASRRRASGAEARLLHARRQAHQHLIRRSKALLDRWQQRERRRDALAADACVAPAVVHRLTAGRGFRALARTARPASGAEEAAAALRAMQDLVEGRIRSSGRASARSTRGAAGNGKRVNSEGRWYEEEEEGEEEEERGRGSVGVSGSGSVRRAWPPAPVPADVHMEHRYEPAPRPQWGQGDSSGEHRDGAGDQAPSALPPATMALSARSQADSVAEDNWARLDAYLGAV